MQMRPNKKPHHSSNLEKENSITCCIHFSIIHLKATIMTKLTHRRKNHSNKDISRSAKVVHVRIRPYQVPLSQKRTVNFLFYFQLPFISIMNSTER